MNIIKKILDLAISHIGKNEKNKGDDYFINLYNSVASTSFAMTVAWCAIFVTAIARLAGVSVNIIPNFASCDIGKSWFQKKGRYYKSRYYGGTYTPVPGDIVFYSSKRTQNDSTHVGYVVSVLGSYLKAIEGNKADAVAYREIKLSDGYIIGYAHPEYAEDEAKENESDAGPIRKMQSWLNNSFGFALAVDGKLGELTKEAMVKAWQMLANKLLGAKLAVDGDYGTKSKAYGNKALVKMGKEGPFVTLLSAILAAKGFSDREMHDDCDKTMENEIIAYQGSRGLKKDGACGSNTWDQTFNE